MLAKTTLHPVAQLILLAVALALLSSCASTDQLAETRDAETDQEIVELQKKNDELTSEIEEEKSVTAKLALELIEKKSEIAKLKSVGRPNKARNVRKLPQIPRPGTRAEAVTYLAEVKAEIDAFKQTNKSNTKNRELIDEAQALFAKGTAQLERDNYDAACFFASGAIKLLYSSGFEIPSANTTTNGAYTKFNPPLQLEMAKRGNLRADAAIASQRIATLAPGTSLSARGYLGDWVKVTVAGGRQGWIYFTLLKVPRVSATHNQ